MLTWLHGQGFSYAPPRLARVALLVVSGVLLAACGTIIGFPDRVLDEIGLERRRGGGPAGRRSRRMRRPTRARPSMPGPRTRRLSTTAVDFGLVSCGAAAPCTEAPDHHQLRRRAAHVDRDARADARLLDHRRERRNGRARHVRDVDDRRRPQSPRSAAPGDTAQGVLTITTNDTTSPSVAVPIKRTAAGGTLSVVPLTAAFGDTPVSVAAQNVPIALKNTGNQAVTIGFGAILPAGGGFTLGLDGLACGASPFPRAARCRRSSPVSSRRRRRASPRTSALNVTGALCGTNPTAAHVHGQRHEQRCGRSAWLARLRSRRLRHDRGGQEDQDPQLERDGRSTWTAALTANVELHAERQRAATSPANSFGEVTVTPNMIPSTSAISPNLYGDTLTITHERARRRPAHRRPAHDRSWRDPRCVDGGGRLRQRPRLGARHVDLHGVERGQCARDGLVHHEPRGLQRLAAGPGGRGRRRTTSRRLASLPTAQQLYTGTAAMTVGGRHGALRAAEAADHSHRPGGARGAGDTELARLRARVVRRHGAAQRRSRSPTRARRPSRGPRRSRRRTTRSRPVSGTPRVGRFGDDHRDAEGDPRRVVDGAPTSTRTR